MHYYGIDFKVTKKLAKSWGTTEIECGKLICTQSFYVKSAKKIKNKKSMEKFLLANFAPSDEFHLDLVDCIYPSTAKNVYGFFEIDGAEFESCCGVPA